MRNWCCSNNPDFAEKAARIIGTYNDKDPNIWFSEVKHGFACQSGRVSSRTCYGKGRKPGKGKRKGKKPRKVVRVIFDKYESKGRTHFFSLFHFASFEYA